MTSPQLDLEIMSLEADMLKTLEDYQNLLSEFADAYSRIVITPDNPASAQSYYNGFYSFYKGIEHILEGFLLVCKLKNVEIKKQSTNK